VWRLVLALAGSVTDDTRDTIRSRLEAGLRAGESNATIADSLGDLFSPRRAYTIAATEASRAMHMGEEEFAREAGASGLEWLGSSDMCEVCASVNGKRVRWGEPFYTRPRGNPAYRIVLHPPMHPVCNCTVVSWWDG